jgi:hypothetical protein
MKNRMKTDEQMVFVTLNGQLTIHFDFDLAYSVTLAFESKTWH